MTGNSEEKLAVSTFGSHSYNLRASAHRLYLFAILGTLMAFASLSTDVYLPAMPAMKQALHAGPGVIEFTVSGYLIGFSLGQLVWGPIGDRYGRRMPVALGLVLFVIGSAGCAMSGSGWQLIGWRGVQSVGACAGVVLARAMVRDLYEGDRAARMMSTLLTVMAVAPLVGPFIGGQILTLASWRAIFWMLVGVGLLTLLGLLSLPETLPPGRRNPARLGHAVGSYFMLLRQRRVLGYAGAGGFFYLGVYAYIAGSPFAYIGYYHVAPQSYGILFALGVAGIMATNLLNARLVTKLGNVRLLRTGGSGAALAGVVLAIDARTGWGGLPGLVVPLFVFVGAAGFIIANSIAGALYSFPERAGTVSALVGALHFGSGIVGSGLVGAFDDGTPWPMGWLIGLAGVGCAMCTWFFVPARAVG